MKNKIVGAGLLSSLLLSSAFLAWIYWPAPHHEEILLDPSQVRVLDGDTITWNGERIRLLGYDTPEEGHPERFHGNQEPWASKASNILSCLVNNAPRLSLLVAEEKDKYGRTLGHLLINGTPSGVYLIQAGYAYPTIDRYGDNGFPEAAKAITEAAANSPAPDFENPSHWRRNNRK